MASFFLIFIKGLFLSGGIVEPVQFFSQKANKTLRLIHRKKRLGPYSSNTRCLKRMRVPAQPLFQISTQEEGPHHPVPNQGPANNHPGAVPNQGPANHQPGAVPSQGPASTCPRDQQPRDQAPHWTNFK